MTTVLRRSLVAAAFALVLGAGSTQAATPKLAADALVGPAGTDLVVTMPPGTESVRKLVVTILSPSPTGRPKNRVVAFTDVPVANGRATVALDDTPRGSDIRFDAAYGDGSEEVPRSGNAIARLRPDVRVVAVHAPPQTLNTRR